ncbi:MAG: molybdate ABC transporter substrate-binding protein [Firmicutes bacterium]|nr:molybdate ABC transporter substrate-binding protein [Bacillota bacterium]
MNRNRITLSIAVRTAVLLAFLLLAGCRQPGASPGTPAKTSGESAPQKTLLVYTAAGLRKPVEEIGAAFYAKTGIKVSYSFGGAAELNSQILLTGQGDLYLPGDGAELKPIREKNLVDWEKDVVYHTPVLAVPKGNPAGLKTLADLARPGVKVALGDPRANPIGKVADELLESQGLLEKVNKNVIVRTPTVNELVVYLTTRQAQAAIIWEENYQAVKDKLDLVSVPELTPYIKTVPVVVLSFSKEKTLARQLAEFVVSPAANAIWTKWGYRPIAK